MTSEVVRELQIRIAKQLSQKTHNIDAARDFVMAMRTACIVGDDAQVSHIADLMSKWLRGDEKYGYVELYALAEFAVAWEILRDYSEGHSISGQ